MVPEAVLNEPTTTLLARARAGDDAARSEFLALVYGELRSLAGGLMRAERTSHTLQPTALVSEAFLRMAGSSEEAMRSRPRFLAYAAKAMRNVLIDHARFRGRAKRDAVRVEMDEHLAAFEDRAIDMLALEEALTELEANDSALARVVELRFFAGLDSSEIAELEGKSERTVRRDLQFARGWLRRRLEGSGGAEGGPD